MTWLAPASSHLAAFSGVMPPPSCMPPGYASSASWAAALHMPSPHRQRKSQPLLHRLWHTPRCLYSSLCGLLQDQPNVGCYGCQCHRCQEPGSKACQVTVAQPGSCAACTNVHQQDKSSCASARQEFHLAAGCLPKWPASPGCLVGSQHDDMATLEIIQFVHLRKVSWTLCRFEIYHQFAAITAQACPHWDF